MRLVNRLLFLALLLALPALAFAGDFVHKTTFRVGRSLNTPDYLGAPNLELITPAEADAIEAIPPRYRKALGVSPWVQEMDAGEKAAVDSQIDRNRKVEALVDAELQLLGLEALHARLVAAGSPVAAGVIQARIDTQTDRITTNSAGLP